MNRDEFMSFQGAGRTVTILGGCMCIFLKSQLLNISAITKSFSTKKKLKIWVILMDKCEEEPVWMECLTMILKHLKRLFVMENVKIKIIKWTSTYHYPALTDTDILPVLCI